MHAGTKVSNYETGSIEFGVGQTQGGDYPITSALRRSQLDEEYLIFVVIDNLAQGLFQLDFF